MSQTIPVSSSTNTITVGLSANVDLVGEDTVIIDGLSPVSIFEDGHVPVFGNNGSHFDLFCNGGTWYPDSMLLKFKICSDMTMSSITTHVFSFNLMNPAAAQESPTISVYAENQNGVQIESSSIDKPSADFDSCTCAPGAASVERFGVAAGADPLFIVVPTFVQKKMSQSAPFAGLLFNVISVHLSSNVGLYGDLGAKLTIAGFKTDEVSFHNPLQVFPTGCSFHAKYMSTWGDVLWALHASKHYIGVLRPSSECVDPATSPSNDGGYLDDADAADVLFREPKALAVRPIREIFDMIIVDSGNHLLRRMYQFSDGEMRVSPVVGHRPSWSQASNRWLPTPGRSNGHGTSAGLNRPSDAVWIDDRTLLVADAGNHAIRLVKFGEKAGGSLTDRNSCCPCCCAVREASFESKILRDY